MRLSLYTYVRDGLFYDFHLLSMLRHHLPLADEIVVAEGFSTDGTYEAIQGLDPKIQIVRADFGAMTDMGWYGRCKDVARVRCTGDWCIYLDADEFIPDWDFQRLRETLETTRDELIPLGFLNFYGNYRVLHRNPQKVHWPVYKFMVHRNRPDIEFWGDGSNVRIRGMEHQPPGQFDFWCHHFGFVRNPARLRQKWREQKRMYGGRPGLSLPSVVFDLLPHRWDDPDYMPDLGIYEGPYLKVVEDDPDEFTRDGMAMYHALQRAGPSRATT